MKLFHISDVLSITTGRLVSSRRMEGIYEILNFLTGDNLFTHQLPRSMRECEPWICSQFPALMEDAEGMPELLAAMDSKLQKSVDPSATIHKWVEEICVRNGLPEMLPVYALGEDMHTRIDPVEELADMVGDQRVIVVQP